MGYQFMTCPESGQLELIESEDTPLGALIIDCSALHDACPGDCPRSCAAILDRGGDRLRDPDDEDAPGADTVDEATAPPAAAR